MEHLKIRSSPTKINQSWETAGHGISPTQSTTSQVAHATMPTLPLSSTTASPMSLSTTRVSTPRPMNTPMNTPRPASTTLPPIKTFISSSESTSLKHYSHSLSNSPDSHAKFGSCASLDEYINSTFSSSTSASSPENKPKQTTRKKDYYLSPEQEIALKRSLVTTQAKNTIGQPLVALNALDHYYLMHPQADNPLNRHTPLPAISTVAEAPSPSLDSELWAEKTERNTPVIFVPKTSQEKRSSPAALAVFSARRMNQINNHIPSNTVVPNDCILEDLDIN